MGFVSSLDFEVKVRGGLWEVFKSPEDPVGVLTFDFSPPNNRYIDGDLKDALEKGLRYVAAWAWNSGLREGSQNGG
jgi:hypothetical protein